MDFAVAASTSTTTTVRDSIGLLLFFFGFLSAIVTLLLAAASSSQLELKDRVRFRRQRHLTRARTRFAIPVVDGESSLPAVWTTEVEELCARVEQWRFLRFRTYVMFTASFSLLGIGSMLSTDLILGAAILIGFAFALIPTLTGTAFLAYSDYRRPRYLVALYVGALIKAVRDFADVNDAERAESTVQQASALAGRLPVLATRMHLRLRLDALRTVRIGRYLVIGRVIQERALRFESTVDLAQAIELAQESANLLPLLVNAGQPTPTLSAADLTEIRTLESAQNTLRKRVNLSPILLGILAVVVGLAALIVANANDLSGTLPHLGAFFTIVGAAITALRLGRLAWLRLNGQGSLDDVGSVAHELTADASESSRELGSPE